MRRLLTTPLRRFAAPRRPEPGRPRPWVLAALLAAGCASFPDLPESGLYPVPVRGAVVSAHPLASSVGRGILDRGGNAVDAAVATSFALAVVFPEAGNLGGGGFAVAVPHDPAREVLALDFRETAPRGLTTEHFLDEEGRVVPERSLDTHLAVGVPGSVAGLYRLHQRGGGELPWRELLEPAVDLARDGYAVDPWLVNRLHTPEVRRRLEAGGAAAVFYPGGAPLAEGSPLVQPALGDTLERIGRLGPDGFYRGETAAALVREMEAHGGVLDAQDLAAYAPVERVPLRGWFRGMEVITMPPPSSGGIVLLQVLAILDGFPLDQERQRTLAERARRGRAAGAGADAGLSGRSIHWWIEAMRRAYADRAEHMGDPDFHAVPTTELLSPEWVAQRRISIGERAQAGVGPMEWGGAGMAEEPVPPATEPGDTTHVSVLDAEGNAVALTTTLNGLYGSGIYVREAGFFLNNEIDDFAIAPNVPNQFELVGSSANAVAGGKRPLSSMTPTVIRAGGKAVTLVLGARGGPKIISAVLQVVLRTEVYGQTLAEAVAAPRLHQQWQPTVTRFEPGWDPLLLQDLRNRDHGVELVESASFGAVQAIRLSVGGEPEAVSDPRMGGAAAVQGRPMRLPGAPPARGADPESSPPQE